MPHLTTLDVGKNLINQLAGFETLKGQDLEEWSAGPLSPYAEASSCSACTILVQKQLLDMTVSWAGLLWLSNLNVRGNPASGELAVALILACASQ